MTSKRTHTKSRLGCKQCKKRRIKCDERPPRCGGCTAKGLDCDFQEYAAVFENIHVLTPSTFGKRSSGSPPSSDERQVPKNVHHQNQVTDIGRPQPPQAFSIEDLGLLHHFTLYTSYTLPVNDSELYCHIWRQEVPKLAQSHGFLMHAVLGFAAAHQATLAAEEGVVDPVLRDYSCVRKHYDQALRLFREEMAAINADKAEALLCFSLLISFTTLFLECGLPAQAQGNDVLNGVVCFLRVVHGSTQVLGQVRESLRPTTIGVLLSHTWTQTPHPLSQRTAASMNTLDRLLATYLAYSTAPTSTASLLTSLLASLRQMFGLVDPSKKGWTGILHWPTRLDPDAVTLLEEGNPIALCALAHWCVAIDKAPRKWFTADWSVRMMRAIVDRLGGTVWAEGIQWPVKEVLGEGCGGESGCCGQDGVGQAIWEMAM